MEGCFGLVVVGILGMKHATLKEEYSDLFMLLSTTKKAK